VAYQSVAELVWPEVEIPTDNHKVAAITGVSDKLTQLQGLDSSMSFMLIRGIVLCMQL